jgi:hypothetical protein
VSRPLLIAAAVLAVLAGGWALTGAARRVYLTPRAELRREIDAVRGRLEDRRAALASADDVRARLRAVVDRTLGSEVETVDHRLRARLNRIAEAVGLERPTVGTGRTGARLSPARGIFRGRHRDLRDEVDFVELEGWVSGEATFVQALGLVEAVHREPWPKHVDQVRLEAKDNGARFKVTVRLTTLLLPGLEPARIDPDGAPPPAPPSLAAYAALGSVNPFHLPAATPMAAPGAEGAPPAASPFPYEQWAVTGVARAGGGTEIWLLNRTSGESRRLTVGDRLGDAVLVAVEGDRIVFEIDDRRVVLAVGEPLVDASRQGS